MPEEVRTLFCGYITQFMRSCKIQSNISLEAVLFGEVSLGPEFAGWSKSAELLEFSADPHGSLGDE